MTQIFHIPLLQVFFSQVALIIFHSLPPLLRFVNKKISHCTTFNRILELQYFAFF